MLYFDHNATSPLCSVAREAWLQATEQFIGNPSSQHRLGARADRALQAAREEIAGLINCSPEELIFTSGATESNNIVFHHYAGEGGSILASAIEHPSVLSPAMRYFADRAALIPVTVGGIVDLDWLQGELKKRTPALVAVMAANNETGIAQPWREVRDLCRSYEIPYLCDASQWLGKENPGELGSCDFVSGCGHKFGGPAGAGLLKVPRQITPLIHGGPQEDGRRAGTENVAGILAMAAALRERSGTDPEERLRRIRQRERFEAELTKLGAQVIGAGQERLWNTVCALMPSLDCRSRWLVKLDKAGVAVSTGSACASGKEKPSPVLTAMGMAAADISRAIRFSSGWETTEEDWAALVERIRLVASELNGKCF